PKKSVVNITRIYTVNKTDLIEKIGQVTHERLKEILSGVQLLIDPREL
ncbi:MAG TPA: type II toxin-antitoxin system PemK/MazF family toxin, partial [Desulfobulbaceae bacterium]|nr:type II toxin-antitoxin system PemK/MazF family toxin [Desulfobulbaceae bacterium]